MPAVHVTALVAAPRRTVAALLRDPAVTAAALASAGHGFLGPHRPLAVDDEIGAVPRGAPPVRLRVTAVDAGGMRCEHVTGPPLANTVTLTERDAGTLMVDELRWSAPPVGCTDLVPRTVERLLRARAAAVAGRAPALAAGPVVVAAALVRDGRVLAARRSHPPELLGRWELPGGRVEAGEAEPVTVVRECREELDTDVRPTGRLGTDLVIAAGLLRVHTAVLAPGAPEPRALEHSALRWVGPDGLAALDWLDADLAVLDDLRELLR